MDRLSDVVARHLTQRGWAASGGEAIFELSHRGESGSWVCFAEARDEFQQLAVYSVAPRHVPAARLGLAAEFITRANYGMAIGNFEMDYDDGEVRFKTSIGTDGERLPAELIDPLVEANLAMMDLYLPALQAVMKGDLAPIDAIAEVEG